MEKKSCHGPWLPPSPSVLSNTEVPIPKVKIWLPTSTVTQEPGQTLLVPLLGFAHVILFSTAPSIGFYHPQHLMPTRARESLPGLAVLNAVSTLFFFFFPGLADRARMTV